MTKATQAGPSAPRWRLRPQVWRWIGVSSLQLLGLVLLTLLPLERPEWSFYLLPILLLPLVIVGVAASIERLRRPPVPRYWNIEEEFRLTIRSLTNSEVLLQSPLGRLADQDLRDLWLPNANLQGVDLTRADLRGANLRGANLRGAGLTSADFSGADLRNAEIVTLAIRKACFRDADLRGANLRGGEVYLIVWDSTLGEADFRGAKYNHLTRWPSGFNPQRHGCILCEDAEHTLPIPCQTAHPEAASHTLPRPSSATGVEVEEVQDPLRLWR